MSEPMTPAWFDQVSGQIIDDMGILLLTLDHALLAEPVLIASHDMNVISNGETYTGLPCYVTIPTQGQGAKRGSIAIDNVDVRIGRQIKVLKGRTSVFLQYVSREDPDDVIYDHAGLFLQNFHSDDAFISAEVVGRGEEGQAWPYQTATAELTPGLYIP